MSKRIPTEDSRVAGGDKYGKFLTGRVSARQLVQLCDLDDLIGTILQVLYGLQGAHDALMHREAKRLVLAIIRAFQNGRIKAGKPSKKELATLLNVSLADMNALERALEAENPPWAEDPELMCVKCKGVRFVPSDDWLTQVIPGQPAEHKCVRINSPHWKCPKCGFAAFREGQAEELCRRVNLAVYGVYRPLVTGAPYLEPIAAYLKSKDRKPFTFRFVNPPLTAGNQIGEQARQKGNKWSATKRAELLEQGIKRISDLATGKVKGLTETQFREELEKPGGPSRKDREQRRRTELAQRLDRLVDTEKIARRKGEPVSKTISRIIGTKTCDQLERMIYELESGEPM